MICYVFTDSPVVVDEGSFDLIDVVDPLLPLMACALIFDFGESSAIITSVREDIIDLKT